MLRTSLPTAYVVGGKVVLTRVCLSTPRGGGYPGRVQAGGVPQPGPGGGGTPHLRYPPSDLAGGYPDQGVPTSGTPIRPGWGGGVPRWGVPHLRSPPVRPGWGVPHLRSPLSDLARGVPHRVVLDTPRSVCLLRSRRTFLFTSKSSSTKTNIMTYYTQVSYLFKDSDMNLVMPSLVKILLIRNLTNPNVRYGCSSVGSAIFIFTKTIVFLFTYSLYNCYLSQ